MKEIINSINIKNATFFQRCCLWLCLLLPQLVWATPEPVYTNGLQGTDIQDDFSFSVTDQKWPALTGVLSTKSVDNIVVFELNEQALQGNVGNFKAWVDVQIQGVGAEGYSINQFKRLYLNYVADPSKKAPVKSVFTFKNIHEFIVTVMDAHFEGEVGAATTTMEDGLPVGFNLYGNIVIDRVMAFNCNTAPSQLTTTASGFQRLQASWGAYLHADEYDLEWTFIDEASAMYPSIANIDMNTTDISTIIFNYNTLESAFKNNASRTTVKSNSHLLTLLYPKGRLLCRYRAAHYDVDNKRAVTQWRFAQPYAVTPHETNWNWQTQMVFAEDGKFTQSVKYFDASLRERQAATLSNAAVTNPNQSVVIVGETIYDYQGRPALKVMPAPLPQPDLSFQNNLSKNLAGDAYSRKDFVGLQDNDCQNGIAPAMKANGTIGAANYYSPNNPQSQTGANGYIPDAKGYPFSVTEFKADATGRIARQGGVGDQYQINSQHETKYYYGTPFQAELDRLFGIDVGLDSHYLKNTVRDANGQYSISYVDAHGRTIATALSGNAPSALGSLNSQPADADILRKKLNSTVIDDIALKATLSYTPTTGGEHRLEYLFDKVTLRQDSCSSFCAECAYDLEILVTADDCAIGQIFKGVWKNYQPNVTSCTLGNASTWTFNPTYVMPNGSSLANLKLMLQDGKTLQVSKILRVSESQRELHLQKFLASCTLPVDSFYRPDFSSCLEDNGAPNLTCDKCKDKKYRAEFEGNYRLSNPDASWESMNAAFEAQCSRDCQRDCDALLETMLVDVYPNGQYGLKDNTNEPLDEFSVYNDNYWRNVNYTDRNGNPIRVNINGIDFNPTELTIAEFRRRFQRDWAYALVHKHPEYCYYEWCRDNSQEENVFGDTLSFNTFMRFVSTQISNVSDHEELKELFADRSFISTLVRDNINPDLFGVINTADPRTGMSIGDLAATLVFCTSQNAQNTGGGADCKPWKLFLENQCEKKFKLFYQRLHTFYIANRRNALLKLRDEKISETCRMTRQKVIDFNRANRANPESEEKDKELRVFDWSQLPIPTDVDQATQQSQQDLELAYKENCEGNAEFWLQQLNVATTDPLYDKMKAYFTKVCAAGADQQHPNGSFDVKKDENGNYTTCVEVTAEDMINGNSVCFRSIIEVYQYFMPTRAQKICNLEDSYYNLTTPGWYGKQYEPLQINNLLEDKYAICERLKFLRNQECLSEEHRQNDTAFVEYINTLSAVQMSVEELKMLMSACDPQAPDCDKDFGDDHVMVSPALQTGVCKSCEEIEKVVAGFECNNLVSFVDYKALLIKYLNHKLGFNLTELEYSTFFDKCKKRKEYLSGEIYFDSPTPQELQAIEPIPCEPMLCPNSEREMYEEVDDVSCADRVRDEARIRAIEAHAQYIEQRKREFVAWYNQKCIDGAKEKESFTFIAPMKMHHYTLYYYDQAGNLVKTVPPAGVVLLTPAQCQAVENLRKSGENFDAGYHPQWGTVRPYHHLKTLYWFNSLNQVIKQNTGEAGDAHFWYDALGRLVLSQNAKQYDEGKLSYTKFDALGRTIEVGQIHTPHNGIGPITLPDVSIESGYEQVNQWARNPAALNAILANSQKEQVTRTYYDEVPNVADFVNLNIPNFMPKNLRNRVSIVTYSETGNEASYDYATHYTYDVAGNVPTLVHNVRELSQIYYTTVDLNGTPTQKNHRFKRLDYDFDLVSGKVNRLTYQRGEPDQMLYRYQYDSDNRLTTAETSSDGFIWERDAKYDYYRHAPLARTTIGARKVQGIDFAYTLQGWIKGVNGGLRNQDIGNDQGNAFMSTTSKDVMGYSIYYNRQDYKTIGGQLFTPNNTADAQFSDLFNGNIRAIVNHIHDFENIAYTYQYDQLNRITGMRSTGLQGNETNWATSLTSLKYKEQVTYDANGNIQTYHRRDGNGNVLDDLTYNYDGFYWQNLLGSVTDNAAATPNFGEDVEGMQTYEYDGNANVSEIADNQGVQQLEWNVYGKVRHVTKQTLVLNGSGTTTQMHFDYDAQQNRLIKTVTEGNKTKKHYYLRDAQGNVLAVYRSTERQESSNCSSTFFLEEQHLYGSSRLGVKRVDKSLKGVISTDALTDSIMLAYERYGSTSYWSQYNAYLSSQNLSISLLADENNWVEFYDARYRLIHYAVTGKYTNPYDTITGSFGNCYEPLNLNLINSAPNGEEVMQLIDDRATTYTITVGAKGYELSNHLGNVLAVVSDKKLFVSDHWESYVLSAQDYYPFGMSMPGRKHSGGTYRYGFNGKETDSETGIQDYGMRWYLPNIARFASVDPLTGVYPELTPYQFASNRPIDGIDKDGLEWVKQIKPVNLPNKVCTKETGSKEVYAVVIGTTTHYASDYRIIGDNIYYKVGKHLYQRHILAEASEDPNSGDKITVNEVIGIQLTSNIEQLPRRPSDMTRLDYHNTEEQTVNTANQYQNAGGVCFLSCLVRYYKAIGLNIEKYSDLKKSDLRIAASTNVNDPNIGYGVGSLLINKGKGIAVDDDGVWNGKLEEGALVQFWYNPNLSTVKPTNAEVTTALKNGQSVFGHSIIFKEYIRKGKEIIGFVYYDASGIEHSIRKDKGEEATNKRFYGTNIKE